MKIKKINFNATGLVLYLFGFIFAPPVIPHLNFIFIVFGYSAFQLLVRKKGIVNEVLNHSGIRKFCNGMFLAYAFILLVMMMGLFFNYVGATNYIKTIYRFVLVFPVTVTCILYIIIRTKELKYSFYDLLIVIVKAGMVQALISILMFFVPSIKQFLVGIMYAATDDSTIQNLWAYQRRFYAFSDNVLDTFGYGTGIIALLPLVIARVKGYKYLLYVPFLLVVPFLNSRTGLVVFGIGALMSIPLFLFKNNIIKIIKLAFVLIIILFCLNLSFKIVQSVNPTTADWVENGMSDLLSVLNVSHSSNDIGYTESTSHLFSPDKWYLPDAVGLLFGTGHNVYQAEGFNHSDVGYINDLWLGGIIGLLLFYRPLLSLLTSRISHYNREIKYLMLFLLASFLVTNVKGMMINYNVGMAITLLIAFSATYYQKLTTTGEYGESIL